MDSYVEYEYDLLIKRISCVDLNMIRPEYDPNPFSFNLWPIYKQVSSVEFMSRVRFCHP